MIAQLMRKIGKGMYSSKQRMIFELLQNADRVLVARTFGFMQQFIFFPDASAELPLVFCREDGVIAIIVEDAVDFHASK